MTVTRFLNRNLFQSSGCGLHIERVGFCQTSGQNHPSADTEHALLMPGLGNQHHPVSTKNPEAQRFFDQGLTLIFAFNHDEAIRSFQRVSELDPQLAMAYWGMALALGPNINLDVIPEREKAAYEAVQKPWCYRQKRPNRSALYRSAGKKIFD